MVRKVLFRINLGRQDSILKTRRDHMIIQAPPDVLGSGLAAIRPPGILIFFLVHHAECIDEAIIII